MRGNVTTVKMGPRSLTRDSDHRDLNGQILVFWESVRVGQVVA